MITEQLLSFLLIGGIFCLIGIVFSSIGLFLRLRVRDWEETTGQIIKKGAIFVTMPDRYPTFRFVANDGNTYEKTSPIHQSPGFFPGRTVSVLYDPDDPARAAINSFVQKGTLFVVIGCVLILFALLFTLVPIMIS